jgi:U3 small nucleolar RNA-associated protein 13
MKAWAVTQKLESFYAGGSLFFSQDLTRGYSLINSSVVSFELPSFKVLGKDFEDILEFVLCPDDVILTYGEDDMIVYRNEPPVSFKSESRVVVMQADKRGLLATGSADYSVKVYQIAQGYLSHKFKHKQPVTALGFCENELLLVSASLDNTVKVWDLSKYNCAQSFNVADTVRFLACDQNYFFAASNIELIKFEFKSWEKKSLEIEISALMVGRRVILGNQQGELISVTKKNLMVKNRKKLSSHSIKTIKPYSENLLVSNEESSIYLLNKKLTLKKEYIGHIDEVLDLKVINETELLLCLNSTEPKILNKQDQTVLSLQGHSDNILCSDVQNETIITGGKDKQILLFKSGSLCSCFKGHTDEVTCVSISRKDWFVSCSLDLTLKVWSKSAIDPSSSLFTCVGHTKDITSVKVSPDSKLIASSSQDKSIKLWSSKLMLKKELLGHKRGVWDLNFHPNDQLLASASGDMTIKVWTLSTFECVRTLEGNQNSILKVLFCQSVLVSTSSDGLLKVWDYKTGASLQTHEAHNGKIWALTWQKTQNEHFLVTGGTDSMVIIWKDVTKEEDEKVLNEKKEVVKLEHDLQISIKNGLFVQAALIAFRLKRPKTLFTVVANMKKEDVCNFVDGLIDTPEGLTALLSHIRDWNCFKKYAAVAQGLLSEVLDRVPPEMMEKDKEILNAIVVYSKKHFERADKAYCETFLIGHLLNEISLMPIQRQSVLPSKRQKVEIS